MDPETITTGGPGGKKKFPTWAKILIALFVVATMGMIAIGFGINYFLSGKRGEELAKKAAGKFLEEVVERASDGKADIKINLDDKEQGIIVIKDKESGQELAFKETGQMPGDFPSDIAVFTPSEFQSHANLMGIKTFGWQTKSPPQEVAKFYQEKMGANGWQTMAATNSEEGFLRTFKKGAREVTVQVGTEESKTVFSIVYGGP